MEASQAQEPKRVSSRFGVRGWLIIFFYGVMLFFSASLTADGLNVIVPTLAGKIGIDSAQMLTWNGYGGWIGVVGTVILAAVVRRIGAKRVMISSLIIVVFAFGAEAFIHGMVGWAVCAILVNVFTNGMTFCAGSVIIASWFPRKAGMAIGWATMGNAMGSAVFVPVFNLMLRRGVNVPFYFYTIILIVMAIVSFFIVFNKPEDVGLAPDNDPATVEEVEKMKAELENYKSPWTVGKLLKCKEIWLAGIGYGCVLMATVGLVQQFVPRAMLLGFTAAGGTAFLSMSAVIGIVSSYIWGMIDTKRGTRFASIWLAVCFSVALLLNILATYLGSGWFVASAIVFGFCLGGPTNFPTSMCNNLFGRKNFQRAFNIVLPLSFVLRAASSVLLGFVLGATGNNYTIAYLVFMVACIVGIFLFVGIDMTPKEE